MGVQGTILSMEEHKAMNTDTWRIYKEKNTDLRLLKYLNKDDNPWVSQHTQDLLGPAIEHENS